MLFVGTVLEHLEWSWNQGGASTLSLATSTDYSLRETALRGLSSAAVLQCLL